MTNLWKGLIGAGLFAVVVLYINYSDKEEIKQEMRIEKLNQTLDEKQFDAQFENALNGAPGSKTRARRTEDFADLQSKIDRA